MPLSIRLICVIGAAITFIAIVTRVRRSRVRIQDAIFWILLSFALLVVAIFPGIAFFFAQLLGFQSPSNFVFLVVITILLIKEFTNTLSISALNSRIDQLVQEQALRDYERSKHEQQ